MSKMTRSTSLCSVLYMIDIEFSSDRISLLRSARETFGYVDGVRNLEI